MRYRKGLQRLQHKQLIGWEMSLNPRRDRACMPMHAAAAGGPTNTGGHHGNDDHTTAQHAPCTAHSCDPIHIGLQRAPAQKKRLRKTAPLSLPQVPSSLHSRRHPQRCCLLTRQCALQSTMRPATAMALSPLPPKKTLRRASVPAGRIAKRRLQPSRCPDASNDCYQTPGATDTCQQRIPNAQSGHLSARPSGTVRPLYL